MKGLKNLTVNSIILSKRFDIMKKILQVYIIFVMIYILLINIDVAAIDEGPSDETEKAAFLTENSVIDVIEDWEEEGSSSQIPADFFIPAVSPFSDGFFSGNYGEQLNTFESGVYQELDIFRDYNSAMSLDMSLGDEFSFTTTYGALKMGTYTDETGYQEVRMRLRSQVFRAADAYFKDKVEVFWIRSISYQATISYARPSETTDDTIITAKISRIKIKPVYYYDGILDEVETVQSAFQSAVTVIDEKQYENRYDLINGIYTYVKDIAEYNYPALEAAYNHTLTGILLDKYEHKCTCEGYAKLLKWLCDYYGIPNGMVIGGSDVNDQGNILVNHIWNVIQMDDGQWYLIDATWDDTGENSYFLAGNNTVDSLGRKVLESHLASPYFSYSDYEPFGLPILAEEGYIKEKPVEVPMVEGLKAEPYGRQKVKLFWETVPEAEGYLVYGRKNGSYGYVGMTTWGETYTDVNASEENNNLYWVYAYVTDSNGKMRPGLCREYAQAKGVCPAVTNLRAASVTGGVRLAWNASRDAEGYLIYGMNGANSNYHYIGMTTRGTAFTDTKASKTQWNFYWVFPYHKNAEGKMIVGGTPKYVYGKAR